MKESLLTEFKQVSILQRVLGDLGMLIVYIQEAGEESSVLSLFYHGNPFCLSPSGGRCLTHSRKLWVPMRHLVDGADQLVEQVQRPALQQVTVSEQL